MKWVIFFCAGLLLWLASARASEVDLEWKRAVTLVKQGQFDFAFADFDSIAHIYPQSRYALPAQFAQGEYFFLQNQLPNAAQKFKDFVKRHPDDRQSLVALAYLYKIAQIQNNAEAQRALRKQLASSHPSYFIFKDKKSFSFVSPFQRRHKVTFSIDKLEVLVDGKSLVEITF